VRCLYAANVLVRAAREATVFAFENAGTSAIRLDNPIQRCLRDIYAGMKHPTFSAIHLRGLGRDMLGVGQLALRL
jgi:alkylation response protein AidB-like acyl-CoA dehydrogenase